MNLLKNNWQKTDYIEYLNYLKSFQDEKYKKFHQKLTITKYEILGLRVPLQRKIAKEILKGDYESFLKLCKDTYYEEVNIMGFVIAGIKELDILEKYYDKYILKIDNWAICDSFCNSLKIVEKNKEYFWHKIKKDLEKEEEFTIRVCFVLMLNFYIEESYIDEILAEIKKMKKSKYYIDMAIAWLLAECYIPFKEKITKYLKEKNLSTFIQNKTISKICDSYRVSNEDKIKLKKLKK